MELMSSLLFCVLVAHLPQALGDDPEVLPHKPELDIKFNNSMMIHQMPMPKKILLNINGPPLVNMVSELQIVFMDLSCQQCIDCMERAIKAYKSHYHVTKTRPRADELHEEILKNRIMMSKRYKREAGKTETTVSPQKKTKTKKKNNKSVTVTKYNDHGEVYALKVQETNAVSGEQNDTHASSCQVYKVKKSSPCDTPEGDAFLTVSKRKNHKTNKKTKKDRDGTRTATTTSTTAAHFLAPAFRKRQVDNSQVPESFMPSIEEMY